MYYKINSYKDYLLKKINKNENFVSSTNNKKNSMKGKGCGFPGCLSNEGNGKNPNKKTHRLVINIPYVIIPKKIKSVKTFTV